MSTALTTTEAARLEQLEETVERGLQTFVEVGTALSEIRDARLYRETHDTFEDYCRERWAMSRTRAYEMIGASTVVGNLSAIADTAPANEAQARPLTKLKDPEEQREAWREVVKTAPKDEKGEPKVTAKHVEATVEVRRNENGAGDVSFASRVRRGMEAGGNIEDGARAADMHPKTFSLGRYVVLMAEAADLTEDQSEVARAALSLMNKREEVAEPYRMIADLVEKKYGSAAARKAGPERAQKNQRTAFMRAFGVVTESCYATPRVAVPTLSEDEREELAGEIDGAIKHLRDFRNRIKGD